MKNLIVSLVIAGVTQLASAQGYPAKPIRIIAAYGPGSTVDIFGRIIAPKLQEAMGQPVIVENRAGAGGNIGTAAVAKAAPDGYTLGLVALGPLVQNPVLYTSVAFDPVTDFAAISLLATGPAVMAVHPSIPAKNVKELVNLAKRRPGELNLGSNGVGSATHIAGEMFKRLTDTDMVHVPYKGNAETITALLGGQVSILFTGVPPVVGLAKAGKVRLLVTTGRQRIPSLPEVPTVAEAGLPAAEMVLWYGVAAPAATPKDIIARLHLEIVKAMSLPEVRQLFSQQGVDPETNSPEQFAQLIRDEYARWGKIIRAAGIKLE